MNPLCHIAIRISDKTYGLPSTVLRHNLVSCRQGAVWFGKPDRGLPHSLVQQLNEQIQAGHRTQVFMIDPERSNLVAYYGELQAVSLRSPAEKELIPKFYKEMKLLSRIKAWLKIGEFEGFRLDENEGLCQANADYEMLENLVIQEAIGRVSFPGYFVLEEAPPDDGL